MDSLTLATWALAVFTFILVLVTVAYTAVAGRGLHEARKTGAVLQELASSIASLKHASDQIASALESLAPPLRDVATLPRLLETASRGVMACVLAIDRQAEVTEELVKLYAKLHDATESVERLTEQGKDWRKQLNELLRSLPV